MINVQLFCTGYSRSGTRKMWVPCKERRMWVPVWVTVVTLLWVTSSHHHAEAQNAESRLLRDLMVEYNRDARPIRDILKPIDVYISFYLTKILGLDEKNQILTTFGWLEVHWQDECLQWKPADYDNLTRIIVPPQLIWLPDFGLENSAEHIYDEQADKKFRAGVDYDGSVQWVPGGKFLTSCQLDITLYPFDSQECEMDFVDWTYDGRFVMLYNGSAEIGMDVYKKHGEWDVVKTEALKKDQYFNSDPGIPFPTVKFVLHLRRKPRFYMINVVAPCLLMSILALLVFYLPPDSGEKVSLGITVLLSFSVFLLLIAENVPKTSDYVPLLGIYLTMVMVMTAFSIVISVVVLDLHHHEPTHPVPRWLRRLAFGVMARAMCMHTDDMNDTSSLFQIAHGRQPPPASTTRTPRPRSMSSVGTHNYGGRSHAGNHAAATHNNQAHGGTHHDTAAGRIATEYDVLAGDEERYGFLGTDNGLVGLTSAFLASGGGAYDDCDVVGTRRRKPLMDEIVQHMREITNKMKCNIKRENVKEEWKLVAKIIDRFLLIVFLLAIISMTSFILYFYPLIVNHIESQKDRTSTS